MSKENLKSLELELADLLVDKNPNISASKESKINKVKSKINKLKNVKK